MIGIQTHMPYQLQRDLLIFDELNANDQVDKKWAAVQFCHVWQHQWVTCILTTSMSVCRSPFGVGMPNLPERFGFTPTKKNCAGQNYKSGGASKVGWVVSQVGGFHPQYPWFSMA